MGLKDGIYVENPVPIPTTPFIKWIGIIGYKLIGSIYSSFKEFFIKLFLSFGYKLYNIYGCNKFEFSYV